MTIILRPLINEKSMGLTKTGFYTFEVDKEATKPQIAKVIADKFKVTVLSVNTINRIGKTKTQRTRKGYFSQPHLKKAIVRVGKGDKIALFEQVVADADPHAGHNHANDDVQVRTAEGEVVTTVKEKKSLLRGTKVKIEKQAENVENDQRKLARSEEHQSATKTSSKPERKPKS